MPSTDQVRAAIRPLHLVFWGGLLCIFDFSISSVDRSGSGFKLDLLNDTLGASLIAWAVVRLAAVDGVSERYARVMRFVKWIALLAIAQTLHAHVVYRYPAPLSIALQLFGLARLGAIVAFAVAMRWFCETSIGLEEAARSWKTTTMLLVVIYLMPLGLLYLAGLIAQLTGTTFRLDLGIAGLLLLGVFVVPLAHMLRSTSHMARAAETV